MGLAIMAGPIVIDGCPGDSEAGWIPALSRNCEAPARGTSQVA
jgi:hypothetical protein